MFLENIWVVESRCMSGKNNPMYGKPSSMKGIPRSEETKKKISDNKKGKHHSNETKQKISQSKKGNKTSLGRKLSEETKEKISKSLIGKSIGNKNPSWKGGISFKPYCIKFNENLKERIRLRDNYQCQMPGCLCTQLESLLLYNQSLHVHHIHYDKPNCNPDLITLCLLCHSKINSRRD